MAKRTHHSNKNQNRKNHRNGIKKPKFVRLADLPGIYDKRRKEIFLNKLRAQQKKDSVKTQ